MSNQQFILHGIKNCDTVRKARRWLDERQIDYRFHDFKESGVTQSKLKHWCAQLGWETVLNKRGTTFRQLDEDSKSNLNASKAIRLMSAQPTLIKRPVLTIGKNVTVGFDVTIYQKLIS